MNSTNHSSKLSKCLWCSAAAAAIDRGDLAALLAADQLRHEQAAGSAFQVVKQWNQH